MVGKHGATGTCESDYISQFMSTQDITIFAPSGLIHKSQRLAAQHQSAIVIEPEDRFALQSPD